jgi:hypothetical protein
MSRKKRRRSLPPPTENHEVRDITISVVVRILVAIVEEILAGRPPLGH